jgi:hypothetical protein
MHGDILASASASPLHSWLDLLGDEEMGISPKKKALLHQQVSEEDRELLLNKFAHSLKSPKRFHQFLDSLGSWLGSDTDFHQSKQFLTASYSFYCETSKESRPSVMQLLHSWFILFLQNPSLLLGFASHLMKEGSRAHGIAQGDQANSSEANKSPRKVSRESQRAHEPLEQTQKRLLRKYGEDQFIITAHRVYEDAKGINYSSIAKNVPVKYISIGQAAEEFQIANHTLATWVADGLLHNVTKVELPAKPEIGVVLVESHEVQKLKEKLGLSAEAAEQKLISLPDAARKYELPYGTVRAWYQRGKLSEKGREVFGTHGGGKILVAEEDVFRLKSQPPARGRPPIKLTE